MTKLFSKEDFKEDFEVGQIVRYENIEDESLNALAEENIKLNNAYIHLTALKETIEESNYNFVTESNYKEINKYIDSICKNIGYESTNIRISTEDLNNLKLEQEIKVISLEGFLSNLWEKIKSIFNKVFEKIKEFFKRYFTRHGRIKGKLNNIIEALNESNVTGLSKGVVENVPSKLNKYFMNDNNALTVADIELLLNNTFEISNSLSDIVAKLDEVSKVPILTSEELASIKKMKEEIAKNKETIDTKEKAKDKLEDELGVIGKIPGFKKNEKETINSIKSEIENLKKDSEEKEKDIEKKESVVSSALKVDEETGNAKLQEEINKLKDSLEKLGKSLDGKKIVNGKVIKLKNEVKEDEVEIIEVDDLEKSETITSVALANKNIILKLAKNALDSLNKSESVLDKFVKLQDNVIKNIDDIDKSIKMLDTNEDVKYNKYKSYLTNFVRPRLLVYKNVVLYCSKLVNTFKTSELDACDGVIEYSVLCMKHFK